MMLQGVGRHEREDGQPRVSSATSTRRPQSFNQFPKLTWQELQLTDHLAFRAPQPEALLSEKVCF